MKKTKVIFIYGPPASGKLTVAKELAKLTKYKVLHNHMIMDMMTPFVPITLEKHQENFWNANNGIKNLMITLAMKENINLIMTLCYAHPYDKEFKKHMKTAEKNGGKTFFVRLGCSKKEVCKRVTGKSRKKYGKATSVSSLEKGFGRLDFFEPIKFAKSYEIKNDNVSAKKTAKMIKEKYKL